MNRKENEQFVRGFFEQARQDYVKLVANFVDDADVVTADAAAIFETMIPDMAYVDDHEAAMAASVFSCSALLAVYLAVQKRGVDVHDFGREFIASMTQAPRPAPDKPDNRPMQERFAGLIAEAEKSQQKAASGEFVYEAFLGDREEFDWGMNITSCAICSAFGRYDALDLVPYMCATDDSMSDQGDQGLRRTGSIAVGAARCDFRYKRGGEPQRLAPQYPNQIRVVQED